MGELTKHNNGMGMGFNQQIIDEFCEQLHALPIDQRKEAIASLLDKLGSSRSQIQMFGNNQNVVGAYQLIIPPESFDKLCGAIENLVSTLKEHNPELMVEMVKQIVTAFANAISK